MTQTHTLTQALPVTPAEPSTPLLYPEAPTRDVVASDAALCSLAKSRPWALGCAIGMFIYALAGGIMGLVWLVVTIKRFADPSFPLAKFIVLIPPNLIGAPLALVGGILAVRYHAAAGRANAWRNSQDFDRALVAVGLIWRWAAVTVVALFALPLIILGIGVITGAWR
jgi:hypothetical protein